MKAIRVHAPGGPETMKLEEVAAAAPAAGQAQVKLEACGVNYIDVYFRTGAYKAPLPLTPGMEGAGTVSAGDLKLFLVTDDRTQHVARIKAMGGPVEKVTAGPRVISSVAMGPGGSPGWM